MPGSFSPALWAELAPRPGVHTSQPPAVGIQLRAAGPGRSPASFPRLSSAEQLGRRRAGLGPAGSPRGLRGSRLPGTQVPKRLLLVGGPAGRRVVLGQGLSIQAFELGDTKSSEKRPVPRMSPLTER